MTDSLYFRREALPFPIFSVIVSLHGNRIQEEFFRPHTKHTLHRMFSVTKSYTALAVCALAAEGRISLQDPIISRFPDYTPADPHPYLSEMTVQDLLDMKTCHRATTYKLNPREHWVRSFFTTPPDHRSGQIFKYDTSAAHTLAALVYRVTGTGILDYLREVFLAAVGFSESAYVIKDPFGDEIGGSGLMASAEDLAVTAEFLMSLYQGTWAERYPSVISETYNRSFFERFRALFCQCVTFRSATMHEGKTLEECQGYGSQFWMIRNGFMMYGMGGQYAAFFPDEDLVIITTADAQSLQGGSQMILDEMNRIDTALRNEAGRVSPSPSRPDAPNHIGSLSAVIAALSGSYRFLPNSNGFRSCTICKEKVTLVHEEAVYRFPVSTEHPSKIRDPRYHQRLFVQTFPLEDGSLYLFLQILDESVGSIRILIQGGNGTVTVYLRTVEESLFSEMNAFLEGTAVESMNL